VLWSLSRSAPSLPAFRAATHFAVNVLSTDQHELALRFARSHKDKFEGVPHALGEYGVPLIDDAAAHF
jgi:flavin reductase (DIM6/NTAB) family NADH-FMN oxidoreductase RutF